MVARTYVGLGPRDVAVKRFDSLAPHALKMLEIQADCVPMSPDDMAMGIALDSLEIAAFHFTRRRNFYFQLERPAYRANNGWLRDPVAAAGAFDALVPYAADLRQLQSPCRPFGADYLALAIAMEGLDTASFHFTREARFFGATSDSSGPLRPTLRSA